MISSHLLYKLGLVIMKVVFSMPKDNQWFKKSFNDSIEGYSKNPEKLTPQHVIFPSDNTSKIKHI